MIPLKSDKLGNFLIEQAAKLIDTYFDQSVKGDEKAEKSAENLLQHTLEKIEKLLDRE